MDTPAFDYRSLSMDERIQLAGDIGDSIAQEINVRPELLPLSDEECADLHERVAEADRDPRAAVPWEVPIARIRSRLAAEGCLSAPNASQWSTGTCGELPWSGSRTL